MSDIITKRHPVRGALYGFLLGLSAAYFAFFQFGIFGFDTLSGVLMKFGILILAGMVIGIVWAFIAPPKKPKGARPDTSPPPAAA